jgi:hypothetical protein
MQVLVSPGARRSARLRLKQMFRRSFGHALEKCLSYGAASVGGSGRFQ